VRTAATCPQPCSHVDPRAVSPAAAAEHRASTHRWGGQRQWVLATGWLGCPRLPCLHPQPTGTQHTGCHWHSGTPMSPWSWRPQSPPGNPAPLHAEYPLPHSQPPLGAPAAGEQWRAEGQCWLQTPLPEHCSPAQEHRTQLPAAPSQAQRPRPRQCQPQAAAEISLQHRRSLLAQQRPQLQLRGWLSPPSQGTEVKDLFLAWHPGLGRGTQLCLPTAPRLQPLTVVSVT